MAFGLIGFACSTYLGQASWGVGYNPNYTVAVIQTSQQTAPTFIDYYDKDLNLVASLEYPYALIQSPWGKPETYDDTVYMTPQGTAFGLDSSVVAALDLKTGKVKNLNAEGGVSNVSANERYVFAAAFGGMGRIDKKTGEVLSIEQSGYLFPFAYGDKVYVFNAMRPDDYAHAWLYIMNEDLELLEEIDFGADSYVTQPTGFIGNKLYFASTFGDDEMPWEDMEWNLSYYSIEDNKVHTLTTVKGMRLEFVASIEDKLYVMATGDTTGDTLNKILIIDKRTGAIEGECKLGLYVPMYLLAKDGILYVGGTNDDRSHDLRSYVPDGSTLQETAKVPLKSYDTSSVRYYITGLFAGRQQGG
jgi:hypothetical protein